MLLENFNITHGTVPCVQDTAYGAVTAVKGDHGIAVVGFTDQPCALPQIGVRDTIDSLFGS